MEKECGESQVVPAKPQVDIAKLVEDLEAQKRIISDTKTGLERSKGVRRPEILIQPFTTPPNPDVRREE